MWQLYMFVLPLLHPYWEGVAYSLHYDLTTVDGIEANSKDTRECCKEVFKHWLRTDSKVGPKTWETLLTQLKKVENIAANVEKVKENLCKMPDM